MKKGKCPKCGSKHIVIYDQHLTCNNAYHIYSNHEDILDRCICLDCGYIETYIQKEKLQFVQNRLEGERK